MIDKKLISTEITDALEIARETRKTVLKGDDNIESQLLGFYTVVQILQKNTDLIWVEHELMGYRSGDDLPDYRQKLYGHFIDNSGQLLDKKELFDDLRIHTFHDSIPKILYMLKTEKDEIFYGVSQSDIDKVKSHGLDCDNTIRVRHPRSELSKLVGSMKLELVKRLNNIISEFTYGEIPESIFEHIREEVDSKLKEICPTAIERLPVIYAQTMSENVTEYSEIAGICRRIVKDVADALFPPSSTPFIDVEGKEHPVTENAYVNRIMARITQIIQCKSESKLFSSMYQYVDGFLSSMVAYASKGDHSEFTKSDAVRCIIYTYLLLGDILHYYVMNKDRTTIDT